MHLLIDGKNLLYRGIYATSNTNSPFVAISRMIKSYDRMFPGRDIHVFWDDHKENLWRRDIHPEYKDSACRNKSKGISEQLATCQEVCEDIWNNMHIRQYKLPNMEADDLIFAFCHTIREDSIIISNDGDMLQIPFRYDHTQVFNPSKKELCPRSLVDPVVFKCLCGDTSDNIGGYDGIGPKTAKKCLKEPEQLMSVLEKHGEDLYIRNRKLIDLALCPGLCDNILYITKQSSKETRFNKKAITEMIYSKHKVRGIMSEYKNLIEPFSRR
jgi:5'-3' exonuclease